jgi:HEPN domain-containing protein
MDLFHMIHPKWIERHYRHMTEAIRGLERGDDSWACYNAYVAVRALLMGVLGSHPYAPTPSLHALPALLAKAVGNPSTEAVRCAYCLERRLTDPKGDLCVKCADLISECLSKLGPGLIHGK